MRPADVLKTINGVSVPERFIDPITRKIIIHPVKSEGRFYDRSSSLKEFPCLETAGEELAAFTAEVAAFLERNPRLNNERFAHLAPPPSLRACILSTMQLKIVLASQKLHGQDWQKGYAEAEEEKIINFLRACPVLDLNPGEDFKATLLVQAAALGNLRLVEVFLSHPTSTNINMQHPDTGATALAAVAAKLRFFHDRYTQRCEILASKLEQPNVGGSRAKANAELSAATALYNKYMIAYGALFCALLDYLPDLSLKDKRGITALGRLGDFADFNNQLRRAWVRAMEGAATVASRSDAAARGATAAGGAGGEHYLFPGPGQYYMPVAADEGYFVPEAEELAVSAGGAGAAAGVGAAAAAAASAGLTHLAPFSGARGERYMHDSSLASVPTAANAYEVEIAAAASLGGPVSLFSMVKPVIANGFTVIAEAAVAEREERVETISPALLTTTQAPADVAEAATASGDAADLPGVVPSLLP